MVSHVYGALPKKGNDKTRFCPPKPSAGWLAFGRLIRPFLFRFALNGLQVTIDPESLMRLKQLQRQRCLLLPNHPTLWDPWVMGALSHVLMENFFYVAAREIFDSFWGLQGWLFQRLGVYSIVRGAADMPSFQMTQSILVENRKRLVIFVEGETSNQNDSLLPLEPGITHLAFLAQRELIRKFGEAAPPIYLIPVAIRYFYDPRGLEVHIDKALRRLEKATGLHPAKGSRYERMANLGQQVLKETMAQWGLEQLPEDSLETRIRAVEDTMLCRMETMLNLPLVPDKRYLERVRRIRNATDKWVKHAPEHESAYHHRIRVHQSKLVKNFYWDLDRIVNVISIYDGHIKPDMSMESYVEVLRRLEREILGYYRFRHPRTAVVTVPEVISLKNYLSEYEADKKATMQGIGRLLEEKLYQGIMLAQRPAAYSAGRES